MYTYIQRLSHIYVFPAKAHFYCLIGIAIESGDRKSIYYPFVAIHYIICIRLVINKYFYKSHSKIHILYKRLWKSFSSHCLLSKQKPYFDLRNS